ncbi:hypothetical protein A8H39_01220 [Paraburkholderia fungorum]|uniref:hypothetical protein n=1 Tax=Paraburkholderia fungorum TaxID=134537 RepID=UPI0004824098|nr:hypothetical protein [Paraburkholderia fungorum]PNE59796.1 hypothetical protein A8H39_01220 [Paraburkholderia fungorum]
MNPQRIEAGTLPAILDIAAAMEKVRATRPRVSSEPLWWNDVKINQVLNAGAAAGYLHRSSTTQVEWTESGVAALALARTAGPSPVADVPEAKTVYCIERKAFGVGGVDWFVDEKDRAASPGDDQGIWFDLDVPASASKDDITRLADAAMWEKSYQGNDPECRFVDRKLAETRVTCPTESGHLGDIVGCGSTNVSQADDEGFHDCRDCGPFFKAEGAEVADRKMPVEPYADWIGMSSQAYKLRYVRHDNKPAARNIGADLIAGREQGKLPQTTDVLVEAAIAAGAKRVPAYGKRGDPVLFYPDQLASFISSVQPEVESNVPRQLTDIEAKRIAGLVLEGDDETALDGVVHDECSALATGINNDGAEAQVKYLLANGWTEAMILKEAGIDPTLGAPRPGM